MKIYSRTGDKGKTSLFSGERLQKNSDRVEAYGTVDELNSFCGVITATLPEGHETGTITNTLREVQGDLFNIGAVLATMPESPNAALLKPLAQDRTMWLEQRIDEMEAQLTPLNSFILPGGHPSSAWAQVARTVCRRAERCVISLVEKQPETHTGDTLPYLNRLSDYFFVLARFCNKVADVGELTWHG